MTIEEAIAHAKEVAASKCDECGALDAVRQCIAIIHDKAGEYLDYGDWESAIPFGTHLSFNEEKFIQENFDIVPKATIAEILAKREKNENI